MPAFRSLKAPAPSVRADTSGSCVKDQVRIFGPGDALPRYTAPHHLNPIYQIGMTIQHLEQLDQGQGRLGFAVLVAGEGIDAAGGSRGLQAPEEGDSMCGL